MSVALLSVLFLQAASAPRPPASNADLPAWSKGPTAAEMAAAYPAEAGKVNLAGSAVLACTVRPDGGLTACEALSESPMGSGFGVASIAVASKFQMPAKSPSGAAMAGRTVEFPIRWLNPAKGETSVIVYDEAGRNGSVAFNCRVTPERAYDNCVVVDAKPRGTNLFGVAGEAALRAKAPANADTLSRRLVVVGIKPQ